MGLMTRDHRYSTRPRTAHAVSSFGTRFTDNNSLPQRSSILMSALTNKRITCGVDRIRKLVWASVSAMQWIAWKLLYHWVLSGRYPSLDQFKSATSATVEWCLDKKRLTILIWPWWIPTKIDEAQRSAESAAGPMAKRPHCGAVGLRTTIPCATPSWPA
jgi:hypothetical protein